MDVQLSIQGGAAKLPALIAAAAAFQDSERAGRLKIRRFAGTSAGAIVAALCVAGSEPLAEISAKISRDFQTTIPRWFKPRGVFESMYRIWRGDVIYEQAHLRTILAKFIDPSARFDALSRPLYIVTSDLETRTSKTFGPETTPEENVLRAVLASTALPFVFVSHRSFGNDMQPVLVDGGICENLPIEPLVINDGEAQFGKVFAISFTPTEVERPRSARDLAGRLVDTSINHAVLRSKAMIGAEYVFPTSTAIKSSDFHLVAERLAPQAPEYRAVRAEAQLWIAGHLTTIKPPSVVPAAIVSTATAPSPDAVMSQAYRAFDILRGQFPYSTTSVSVTVTVDSLWPPDDPRHNEHDKITQVTRIESATPLVAYGCTLGEIENRSTNVVDVRAYTLDGQAVAVEHLRALRPVPNGTHAPYLVIFFHGSERPAQLVIKKTFYLRNSMNLLRDGRTSDYFTVEFPRETHDRVQEVTIVLNVPSAAGTFVLDKPTTAEAEAEDLGAPLADGRMLEPHEIADYGDGGGVGYSILAWRAKDVAQSGAVVTTAVRRRS